MIENLPQDIKEIEKNSAHKIDIFAKKVEQNTADTIKSLEDNIEKTIEIEEKKISNIITEETRNFSIEKAKQNIINLLNSNPELHNKFIQNSIDELDKVKI